MARKWFHDRGDEPRRTKSVALAGSWRGARPDAATPVGAPRDARIAAPPPEPMLAPSPDAWDARPGQSAADCAEEAADALARLLDEHPGEAFALVLEPRLQCAAGMRMHHPVYLRRARELCDVHGMFLVADETRTGFGRTGTMFAFEQAGVMPDLMCVSNGLAGGALPLAAVLATQALHDGAAEDPRRSTPPHPRGPAADPLACAAALASLDIFESGAVIARNRATAAKLGEAAAPLAALPHVAEVRQAGMVVAFELTRNGDRATPFDPAAGIGLRAGRAALDRGVLLQPLGDVLYWMPPYCIDDAQIALLAEATGAAIIGATAKA